jgi:hypothetical protein
MGETTRDVRIKVDLVVRLDRDVDSIPFDVPEMAGRIQDAIGSALVAATIGATKILAGTDTYFSLDFRRARKAQKAPAAKNTVAKKARRS